MKDITFPNIIHKVKILCSPSFSSKIAALAENVRLEGSEKKEIASCSGPTGNKSPVLRGLRRGGSVLNILESVEEHYYPELKYKSQILWPDIRLLLSRKVVRLHPVKTTVR